MRVILYTGKGGVGKTSVAAATAVRCAQQGLKTLVMSTDAAHSLGDSLDVDLGPTAQLVAPNLWAQEVNALHELENNWERIHGYLAALFNSQGIDDIVAEEMASPPGMEEVASLMWIKHHAEHSDYDVLIVDCAPTGETLQLLAFPDVARWYLTKIFPIERRVMKLARPMVQPFISIPLPSDEIFTSVRDLLVSLDSMRKVIGDPRICTVRIVLNLEKMVIKEAQRAF
ncbi:MAG TPA: TRC40/GET3/ArsA family transport-energizing ATPase, partial [Candidatus Dormibacteraeota bacterium]|nr:TRC40/GET3/ArsA family transport-energizing ATPase [Candidatus Dormibacteraeota bacterium]